MLVIYADVLLAINFSMDFLSLFITSIFLHLKIKKLRIILAALLGAVYAFLQMVIDISGISLIALTIASAIIMVNIAFSEKKFKRIMLITFIYMFVSMLLGGIMSLLYSLMNNILAGFIEKYSYEGAYNSARIWIIISLTAIASVVFSKILTSKKEIKEVDVIIVIGKTKYELKGLCDSGNLLKEPFSGRNVILVSEEGKIGEEIQKIEDIHKKFIPYRDVSGEGVLRGVVPKTILINGILVDAIVATTKNKSFSSYGALVPRALT